MMHFKKVQNLKMTEMVKVKNVVKNINYIFSK